MIGQGLGDGGKRGILKSKSDRTLCQDVLHIQVKVKLSASSSCYKVRLSVNNRPTYAMQVNNTPACT